MRKIVLSIAAAGAALIAASPADVDEGAIAYLRRNRGARILIVFATRGEGGDSLFVGETGDALGLTRTREALQFALQRGSRSGRVAWQFAKAYAGSQALKKRA